MYLHNVVLLIIKQKNYFRILDNFFYIINFTIFLRKLILFIF